MQGALTMKISRGLLSWLILLMAVLVLAGLLAYKVIFQPIQGELAFDTLKGRSCIVEARGLFHRCYKIYKFLDLPPDEHKVAYTQVSTPFRVVYINGEENRLLTEVGSPPYWRRWSPDGERIAYTKVITSSDRRMCVVNGDGTGDTCLEIGMDLAYEPSWSPDSKRIAFAASQVEDRDNSIYVINTDGTNLRLLVEHADFPSWSPDGERIAFSSDRTGDHEIYVIDVDGGDPIRLAEHPADDMIPVWSPDGDEIAFLSSREGKTITPNWLDTYDKLSIYIMGVDGSDVRKLLSLWGDSIEYFVWYDHR
jgi:TolB protein